MAENTLDNSKSAQTQAALPAAPTVGEPPKETSAPVAVPPATPANGNTSPAPQVPSPLPSPDEPPRPVRPQLRPHAFIVMPFGQKKGGDGSLYNFNVIYDQLIKPALIEAGFEPFRADEETASGDILTDMFQELLLADLVLADLSIDNANAFYELGIRHAFRRRGVMHIQAGRAYMPFDIFNVRTLPYHINDGGVPDEKYLKSDIKAIARMAKDTWASDRDAVHSPIFNLLTGLKEPERKTLRTPLAKGFWREYDEWRQRVTIAQRQKRIGDILLLTEEIQNPLIKEEAIGEAGKALANMGRNELALIQYRKGIDVNPANVVFRREEAFHLNRTGKMDDAIVKLESLLTDVPNDSETIAYLGRIYKEMWVNSWKDIKDKVKRTKAAFDSYHWLIKSIDIYLTGYRMDLNNYYPGVNALTLSTIALHLADLYDNPNDPDPDITRIRVELEELRGALIFALEARSDDNLKPDYWSLISLAELRVLTANNIPNVTRAYRKALTASRRSLSSLQSSVGQLKILEALGMRSEYVRAGLDALNEEIGRVDKDAIAASKAKAKKPVGQVFLFTGYMVDEENKNPKTFPANMEDHVCREIRKRLEKLNACSDDVAYTAGLSAGSEIIFAEMCAERGIRVNAFMPVNESQYIRDFVSVRGDDWVNRFYKVRNHPLVDENYMPERIGEAKEDVDKYERNNRWALYSSLVRGVDKVRLIALWDGKSSYPKERDAQLVKHMIELMRDTGGAIEVINTSKFMHGPVAGMVEATPENVPALPAPKPLAQMVNKKKDTISQQRRKKM